MVWSSKCMHNRYKHVFNTSPNHQRRVHLRQKGLQSSEWQVGWVFENDVIVECLSWSLRSSECKPERIRAFLSSFYSQEQDDVWLRCTKAVKWAESRADHYSAADHTYANYQSPHLTRDISANLYFKYGFYRFGVLHHSHALKLDDYDRRYDRISEL